VKLPGFLLRHKVIVEPFAGTGPFGDTYGPPVEVRCFLEEARRKIRGKDGSEIVSEATFYARPGIDCPEGSKVTLPSGRVSTALKVSDRDGGGLPTPDHVEVALT
jgi:hypothetical protein